MNDFEVAPRGYLREIALSRALANSIATQLDKEANPGKYPSDACKLPPEVIQAYKRLYGEYIRQQQEEMM
jgi:hypothetical protein